MGIQHGGKLMSNTKTIKQVADELGTNKQAVRRCMERCSIQAVAVNGVLHLTEPQYKAIFSSFAEKRKAVHVSEQPLRTETDVALVSLLKEQIQTLRGQVALLQNQLDAKDRQISDLSAALVAAQQSTAAATEIARAAQALHAGTIQQQLESHIAEPPRRRWPWQRKEP